MSDFHSLLAQNYSEYLTFFFLGHSKSPFFLILRQIFGKQIEQTGQMETGRILNKVMLHKPQKLQLNLTIQFAIFFILISGYTYYYFNKNFRAEVYEKFQFKSEFLTRYIEQNPQFFYSGEIKDKTQLIQLMYYNDVSYLVLQDRQGNIIDAVNSDVADYYSYAKNKQSDDLSFDDAIYQMIQPVYDNHLQTGNVYIGFNAGMVGANLKKKTLLTALFSLSILLAGMVFTYFLSSISFRPITKLINVLSKANRDEQKLLLTKFRNNEIGTLAGKIYNILNELDKSSNEVNILNEKLKSTFREKMYELDLEINHRKKAETFLKKTEEMFKLLFENAPIGMCIVSADGRITRSNKAFCNTVGYEEHEIIGAMLKMFFNGEGSRRVKPTHQMIIENESLDTEVNLIKRSGHKVTVLLKTIKIYDEQDVPINTLLQVLDITQIKKVQAELSQALDKAKESDRLKSAFLAQMSHEIRTPLNVILPSIKLMAEDLGSRDADMISILNAVENAGKRLHRTIDMILSMSAVQSGNFKPKFETFNIAEEIKNLTQEFAQITRDKGLKLYFTNNTSGSQISADRYTIGQIFQNLIGYAVKYTHSGYVSISLEDYDENSIVIKVEDSGIGISSKYLNNLFSPFSQEDSGQTRKYEGNGLGLALVKEYVSLNKGQISVQSEKYKGTVFSVIFDKKLLRSQSEIKNTIVKENKILLN